MPAPWRSSEVMFGDGRALVRPYTPHTHIVYATCMSRVRTNIEIEDTYLQAVMDRYGLHTKTEAVDLALRHLAGQPMSREEALAMRGVRAIGKVPADTSPARVQ
jgi:Arc/MetJ family transcription regulator